MSEEQFLTEMPLPDSHADLETVLAALHCCRTRLYQAEICNTRPLGEGRERAPFFETVRADPPMLAGR